MQDRLLDLLASSPHVAVISVYYPRQLLAALTLGDQLKKAAHRLHIILEGRAPTALASLWHSHPELFRYFDSVVIGQSDRPVSALARCEVEGGSPSQVPGLIYRERGEVRTNAEEAPEAMEILPPPDFDGLPLGRYLAPHPVLPLQAAQGCYWGQCRFCAYNAERHFSAYRPHSAQWLVTAMEQLATRYNAVHFTFADEAVSPDLLEEVAREIVRRGLKVWWQAQTRPEAGLTPERCRLRAQSGCVNLQFCFETASDALAQRMRMGLSRTERKAALVSCARAGILTHVFVGLGLPGERSA